MKEKVSAANRVREVRRKTRKKYSSEEKVRIVLEGLCGEESISELCRREPDLNRAWDPESRHRDSFLQFLRPDLDDSGLRVSGFSLHSCYARVRRLVRCVQV